MLHELRVENLGIIVDLLLPLAPGMTVITGETGAGKTLIVDALDLLCGGRADASLVRDGADEARVEGLVGAVRSEEHTSELQSRRDLVCRLLLEKKKRPRNRCGRQTRPGARRAIR